MFIEILRYYFQRVVDYLKFDVEFAEWTSILSMVEQGCLAHVKQLAFEIHSWPDTIGNYTLYWRALQALQNAGFAKWRLFNRDYRCFKPIDESGTNKTRCPQADVNYVNIRQFRFHEDEK